jgi:bacterioferritin-associated ferredoxin
MAGPLTNQQRSSEYYRIAYKCAEVKSTKGCDSNCAACVLNVHLYVDDVRDATLIKTSAALNYVRDVAEVRSSNAEIRRENKWSTIRLIGWIVLDLFILFICIALIWVLFILPISWVVRLVSHLCAS